MKFYLGWILVLCFFIQACAHQTPKAGKTGKIRNAKLLQMAQTKPSLTNSAFASSVSQAPRATEIEEVEVVSKDWVMPENDRLYFELSGERYENLNSKSLYDKIAEKYRSSDLKAVESYTNILIGKYPQSRYADSALYLQGMLAFTIKSYAKSLESFQKIINLYPHGKKVVSALFAKGELYKKMNLKVESENVLRNIKTKYPGSPESMRSEAELKNLN